MSIDENEPVKEDKILEHHQNWLRWSKYTPDQIDQIQENLLNDWLKRYDRDRFTVEERRVIERDKLEYRTRVSRDAIQRIRRMETE
jgi:hypothetical protein